MSGKRGQRQFGTIRKLPSGQWQARYRDPSGRQVSAPATFASKGDAAAYIAARQTDINRSDYVDPRLGKTTLAEWATQWLALPGKRPRAIERDRIGLAPFLEALGRVELARLTPLDIQAVVNGRAETVRPATVHRDVAALRAVLSAAVDADMIGRSPLRKVALPKRRAPERASLEPNELAALVDEMPARFRALVLTAGVLGLRWGEAIALRVRDIHTLTRIITVAQTVEELNGTVRIVPETKTDASRRTIAAPPFLIEAIAAHLAAHRPGVGPDDLVFVGDKGGVLRRSFSQRVFNPAAHRAGLEGLTFHGLRHAAVSAMVSEGVHPRIMAKRAGHSASRLTLDLYSHVSDEADKDAARLLQTRFAGAFAD
jgi:integrase